MQKIMKLERFATLVDAYGGHPARWDARERDAALALLAQSAEAQRLQQAALEVDAQLDLVSDPQIAPFLAQRIVNNLPSPIEDSWQWLVQWIWGDNTWQHLLRPALALGLPLVFGLWLGINVASEQQNTTTTQIALEQFSQNELSTLFGDEPESLNNEWSTWL